MSTVTMNLERNDFDIRSQLRMLEKRVEGDDNARVVKIVNHTRDEQKIFPTCSSALSYARKNFADKLSVTIF